MLQNMSSDEAQMRRERAQSTAPSKVHRIKRYDHQMDGSMHHGRWHRVLH